MQDKTIRLDSKSLCGVRCLVGMVALMPRRWWVLLFFLGQLAGSLGVMWLLKLSLKEIAVPLGFLVAGAVSSVGLPDGREGPAANPVRRWMPALLYAAFIFSLSHRSFTGVSISFSSDLFHPVEFASLGLLLCLGWYPAFQGRSFGSLGWRVILVGMIFAVSDEMHQAFVPGRSPSLMDLVFDFLGLSAAVGAFWLASRVRRIGAGNSLGAGCS